MSLPIPQSLVDSISYNTHTGEVRWNDSDLPVASCTVRGYLQVRWEGKGYKLARVLMFKHSGVQSANVRHVNCCANDFRISNLVEASS